MVITTRITSTKKRKGNAPAYLIDKDDGTFTLATYAAEGNGMYLFQSEDGASWTRSSISADSIHADLRNEYVSVLTIQDSPYTMRGVVPYTFLNGSYQYRGLTLNPRAGQNYGRGTMRIAAGSLPSLASIATVNSGESFWATMSGQDNSTTTLALSGVMNTTQPYSWSSPYNRINPALAGDPIYEGVHYFMLDVGGTNATNITSYVHSITARSFQAPRLLTTDQIYTVGEDNGCAYGLSNAVWSPDDKEWLAEKGFNKNLLLAIRTVAGPHPHRLVTGTQSGNSGPMASLSESSLGAASPSALLEDSTHHSSIAMDAAGVLHLVYVAWDGSIHLRIRDGLTSFTDPVLLHDTTTAKNPSISIYTRAGVERMGVIYGDTTGTHFFEHPLEELVYEVKPSGIASINEFGSGEIVQDTILGIPSLPVTSAFGAASLTGQVEIVGEGISTREVFGLAEATQTTKVRAEGIASKNLFGATSLSLKLYMAGILPTSGVQAPVIKEVTLITTPSVEPVQSVSEPHTRSGLPLPGIQTREAFGSARVSVKSYLMAAGFTRNTAFGLPSLEMMTGIRPGSFTSSQVGTPVVGSYTVAQPINSQEAFGVPVIRYTQGLQAWGITTQESVSQQGRLNLRVKILGIPRATAFGIADFRSVWGIYVGAIASQEAVNGPSLADQLGVQGISSQAVVGYHTLRRTNKMGAVSINPAQLIGVPKINLNILMEGLPSTSLISSGAELRGTISPQGIYEGAFGKPLIRNEILSKPLITLGPIL